jgi:hypothetical protein
MKTGSLQKADSFVTADATASVSNNHQRNAHGDVGTVTRRQEMKQKIFRTLMLALAV